MNDPRQLNADATAALRSGDASGAARLFRAAAEADGAAPELWVNAAAAYRMLGDDGGEGDALDQALRLDQLNLQALIRKAQLKERTGQTLAAIQAWNAVLALAPPSDQLSEQFAAMLAAARAFVENAMATFGTEMDRALAPVRSGLPQGTSRRFDRAVDAALGRSRIYQNQCHGLHFPFLPADEIFDRALFPWLGQIEARTDAIRDELRAFIAGGSVGLEPYVAMEPGTPETIWTPLDQTLDWGALHLWRHGVPTEHLATFPQTAEALALVPGPHVTGRMPTAFFSLLKPRTQIPPHTGVTNTRAVVHLALIVPPGCALRVGGETRGWKEGEAFAFDDTIEHEAWNNSDALRAVLIFDCWNPHLSEDEQNAIVELYRAADSLGLSLNAPEGGAGR